MNKYCLALMAVAGWMFVNFALQAATPLQAPPPHAPLIAVDDHDKGDFNEQAIASGEDSFLARPATPAEIAKHDLGVFQGDDQKYYKTVGLLDLHKMDKLNSRFIDQNDIHASGLVSADRDLSHPNIIHITQLTNENFAGIDIPAIGEKQVIEIWTNGEEAIGEELYPDPIP